MFWVDICSYTQCIIHSKYVQIIKAVYISFLYSSIPYRPILGAPLGHPSFKVVGATALQEVVQTTGNYGDNENVAQACARCNFKSEFWIQLKTCCIPPDMAPWVSQVKHCELSISFQFRQPVKCKASVFKKDNRALFGRFLNQSVIVKPELLQIEAVKYFNQLWITVENNTIVRRQQ